MAGQVEKEDNPRARVGAAVALSRAYQAGYDQCLSDVQKLLEDMREELYALAGKEIDDP